MKIYDEVTIDMNPESSTYGEHLSEESHEYEGDVALCGGARGVDIRTNKGKMRPGLGALGLEAYGHQYPKKLPGVAGFDQLYIPGVLDSPAGTSIEKQTAINEPEEYTGKRSGRFLGLGKRRTEKYGQENIISGTGPGSFKQWYGPGDSPTGSYLDVGVRQPLSQIRAGGWQPASELGLDPSILAAYGGTTPEAGGVADAIVPKGLTGDINAAQYDLEQARKFEDQEQKRLAGELDILEKDKEAAMTDEDINRRRILSGETSAYEERQAQIAGTGMARSGPAKAAVGKDIEAGEMSLGDIARKKRTIQSNYQRAKDTKEGEILAAEDDLATAEHKYGTDVGGILSDSSSQVQTLLDAIQSVPVAHQGMGAHLTSRTDQPGGGAWAGSGSVPAHGRVEGGGGHGAPAGGWFGETSSALPGYSSAISDVDAATAFADYISNLTNPAALAGNVGYPEGYEPGGEG